MSSFLTKSEVLISSFPTEEDSLKKLLELIQESDSRREYTLERLIDLTSPSSTYIFLRIIEMATRVNVLKKVYRVVSDTNRGLAEFSSLEDIPEYCFDDSKGFNIEVTPDNIKIVFSKVNDD